VVGRHKDTPRLRSGDGQLSSASSALPLYEGAIAAPSRSERWPLLLGCRNGEFLEVESLVRRLPGPGDRFAVEVLDVVACIGRSTAPGEASEHDPLTRLHGRAEFLASLKREFQRAVENSAPLALVLLDVDHLRRVNDTLGRRAGDDVLRKLAGILRATVGERDVIARFGDDEFAALLPDAGRGEARQMAARLRSTVERFGFFAVEGDDAPKVTLSLGAASYPADAENDSDLLSRAREALNEARTLGRNRVWCYMRRPRVPLRVPVFFDGVEPLLLGESRDLSPSGLFIETATPVEIGMRCALAFPLPASGTRVHVIGRVVRSVGADEVLSTAGCRTPGMGIEFERFGPGDREAIGGFLHRNESSSLRPENGTLSVS
jgi:diguanylate cyclase (GGDEF)-like protein